MGRGFAFMLGTMTGIYITQSYNVPNIKKLVDTGVAIAKDVEERYRKPNNNQDDQLTENYNVPNIKQLVGKAKDTAERQYCKHRKNKDDQLAD